MKFIKNKFNIALIIIQVLAIISYALSGVLSFFVGIFFTLEGVFFLVWGIKILKDVKSSRHSLEVYSQLPYTEEEKKSLIKKSESISKNNRFIGIILILMGVVLLMSVLTLF